MWNSLTNTNGVVDREPGPARASSPTAGRGTGARACKVGEHALLKGTGAGGFQTARTRYTSDTLVAGHAHSYVIETFADFGLIGTLLSLALLVAWAIATGRTLGCAARARAAGASAHAAERAGHAHDARGGDRVRHPLGDRLDLVLPGRRDSGAGVRRVAGRARPAERAGRTAQRAAPAARGSRPRARALVAIVAIALGAAWVVWQPLRSSNADASAVTELLAGDTRAALADAHTAVSADPVSADALWELSEIDLAVGDRAARASRPRPRDLPPARQPRDLAAARRVRSALRPAAARRSSELNKAVAA